MMAHIPATLGAIVLLGYIHVSAADQETCDLYAAVGERVSLPFANNKLSNEDILRWHQDKKIIFYQQRGRVSVGKPDDIAANGALMLKNLQLSSSGNYHATLLHSNGTLAKSWTLKLCVMNKVSKPKLAYTCDSETIYLKCEIANPQDLFFSWTLNGNPLTGEKRQTLSVSLSGLRGEGSFKCTVSNRVSQESSNPVRPACQHSMPSPPGLTCLEVKTFAAVLAGGGGLILFLLIIIIVLCISRCKKDGPQSSEKLRMLSVSKREPDSSTHEYETMRVSELPEPPGPEGLRPSPVPKPRTKNHQTPNK